MLGADLLQLSAADREYAVYFAAKRAFDQSRGNKRIRKAAPQFFLIMLSRLISTLRRHSYKVSTAANNEYKARWVNLCREQYLMGFKIVDGRIIIRYNVKIYECRQNV